MVYGIGGMANRLISLLLLPIFTAYLTPTDYGLVGMLAMSGMVLTPVFSLGFGTSIGVCYFNTQSLEERKAIIWNSFLCLAPSAALMLCSGWLFSRAISSLLLNNGEYSRLVILSLATTAVNVIIQPFQLKLQFEQKARAFVIFSFVSLLVTTVVSVYEVVWLKKGVTGLLEAQLIGQLFSLIIFSAGTFKSKLPRFTGQIVKELLRHGIPMVPSFFFIFIIQNGVRYFLEVYYGLHEVGIFTVGTNLGMFMGMLTGAFISSWTPYALAFSDKQDEARVLFGRITYYYMLVFGFLTALFFFFAKSVVILFVNVSFYESYKIIGFSAAGQYYCSLFLMLLPPVYFAKDVSSTSKIQGLIAAISVIVALVVLPFSGVIGAGLIVCLSYALLVVFQWVWNSLVNKRVYFQISYDVVRIVWVQCVLYLFVFASFLQSGFVLWKSLAIGGGLTLTLAVALCFCLNKKECNSLLQYIRSLLGEKKSVAKAI